MPNQKPKTVPEEWEEMAIIIKEIETMDWANNIVKMEFFARLSLIATQQYAKAEYDERATIKSQNTIRKDVNK